MAKTTVMVRVLYQDVVCKALEALPDDRERLLRLSSERIVSWPPPWDVVKECALFQDASADFMEALRGVATFRIFMPGDLVTEVGSSDTSMFIMVEGVAFAYVIDREDADASVHDAKAFQQKEDVVDSQMVKIGQITVGQSFGEMTMMGVSQIRTATIKADTICYCWQITQEIINSLIARFPEDRARFTELVLRHLERTVPPRIINMKLFANFTRQFRTLISLYCDRSVFYPGLPIVSEGTKDDSFYIINVGVAAMTYRGVHLQYLRAGSHFGAAVMLGINKKHGVSVVARHVCHVVVIALFTWMEALDKYPNPEPLSSFRAVEKARAKTLAAMVANIPRARWFNNLKLRRSDICKDAMRQWMQNEAAGHDMLCHYLAGWHNTVLEKVNKRRLARLRKKSYNDKLGTYLDKRRNRRRPGCWWTTCSKIGQRPGVPRTTNSASWTSCGPPRCLMNPGFRPAPRSRT